MTTILVTGGAGYIGTHTDVELLNKGYDVVCVDNYSNSSPKALDRVEEITGKTVKRYEGDVRDEALMDRIFTENDIDWVIHFASLKSVGESVAKPIEYYDNNLNSTIVLLKAMRAHDVKKVIFSSSATVYGTPKELPLTEESQIGGTTNPYGTTKFFEEQILRDVHVADDSWTVVILRYFNPVGAHESGLIGEDPKGIPANLTPYIAKVALGELKEVQVFGDDYDTPDGTGVRDYIHVVDLPRATSPSSTRSRAPACSPTTWVPVTDTRYLRSSRRTRRLPATRFRSRSSRVAPATSPPATPTPPRPSVNSAGRPSSASTTWLRRR